MLRNNGDFSTEICCVCDDGLVLISTLFTNAKDTRHAVNKLAKKLGFRRYKKNQKEILEHCLKKGIYSVVKSNFRNDKTNKIHHYMVSRIYRKEVA